MSVAKHQVLEMVESMPDESSLEDIQYHLYVRQKVEKALAQVSDSRTLSNEEVHKRMDRWLSK